MTERELAEALGIQQQAVNKCIHEGMPTDSIDAARTWRQSRRNPDRAAHKPSFTDALETPNLIVLDDADPYAIVDRLRMAELTIAAEIKGWSEMMPDLTSKRDHAKTTKAVIEAEKKLSQLYLKLDYLRKEQRAAIKAVQEAQLKLVNLEKIRGKLIALDSAKDYVTRILTPVLIHVRKLPDLAQSVDERSRLVTIAEGLLTVIRAAAEEALKDNDIPD